MKNKKTKKIKLDDTTLKFLKKTKDGKYAKIDKNSIPYSRIKAHREYISPECEYYYGLR